MELSTKRINMLKVHFALENISAHFFPGKNIITWLIEDQVNSIWCLHYMWLTPPPPIWSGRSFRQTVVTTIFLVWNVGNTPPVFSFCVFQIKKTANKSVVLSFCKDYAACYVTLDKYSMLLQAIRWFQAGHVCLFCGETYSLLKSQLLGLYYELFKENSYFKKCRNISIRCSFKKVTEHNHFNVVLCYIKGLFPKDHIRTLILVCKNNLYTFTLSLPPFLPFSIVLLLKSITFLLFLYFV